MLELIDRCLADDFRLEALAAAAGVSRFHFVRLFKNTLSERRTAAATGVSSQRHLSTTMRRQLGVTPGQWRRSEVR